MDCEEYHPRPLAISDRLGATFASCVVGLIFYLALPPVASAQSSLWGEDGSAWATDSILPEFSYAGYHRGDQPPPEPKAEVSVTDFGAKGDGETDDTEALRRALREAAGKTIGIPAGTYVISGRLDLFDPNTVLVGEGPEKTILRFTRGLQEIEPASATTGGGMATTQWSWSGGLITLGKSSGNGGSGTVAIVSEARRGESAFEVENADAFKVGEALLVRVTDSSERTLLDYVHRGRTGDISRIGTQAFSISQPVTVAAIDGQRVTLDQRLRFDLRPEWSPVVSRFDNPSQEIGIAEFTIAFPERPYRGHWMEDGLNGFEIRGANNWARNIRVRNSDSGAFVTGTWCTVDGLVLESDREAHESGNTGHHGLTVQGRDCLATNFAIETRFFHDITVSNNSVGSVISRGRGVDLSLDHHRAAPYENLFTEIDLGEGGRVFDSGGTSGKGLHTASGATFWNLDAKNRFPLPGAEFGPPGTIFVGVNAGTVRSSDLPEGWHFEKIRPESLQPPNLHLAQLQRRRSAPASGEGTGGAGEFHSWTNSEGNTLEARFHGLGPDGALLETRDGRRFAYPLEKLDPASRALARRLAE
ncbi:MAG: hypothetical protein H7A52_16490 [Akkermansiaceae bacterium]|nr:hypothetical protein [Akkermansiaceae bacterium]